MPETHVSFPQIAIIGANGAVGGLLCAQLSVDCRLVTAIDLQPASRTGLTCARYVCADARAPDIVVQSCLASADLVVLAVPEGVVDDVWSGISCHLSARSLVVDTLSVKSSFCAHVRQHGAPGELLSINPMFAPAAGFAGNNVAVVRLFDGPRSAAFVHLLQTWGCTVTELSADEHDRLTAAVQVATHAAVLAFGLTLRRLQYDPAAAWALSTPPHRALLGLLARITSAAPEVYWDIQSENPHARDVRSAMTESLSELARVVDDDDLAGFRRLLRDLKPLLQALPNGP